MGFFSFLTNDTHESVSNKYSDRGPLEVYLHDDKGNVWHEPDYDGYGVFGGKDYYELMAEMNGMDTSSRERARIIAIEADCDYMERRWSQDDPPPDINFPQITRSKEWKWDGTSNRRTRHELRHPPRLGGAWRDHATLDLHAMLFRRRLRSL